MATTATHHPPRRFVSMGIFEVFAREGRRFEVLAGEWFEKPPAGCRHSRFVLRFPSRIERFVDQHGLGEVYGPDIGIVLQEAPLSMLGPDVTFVRSHRLPPEQDRTGFLRVTPDLVVEVLSPERTLAEATLRAHLYLALRVPLIWVADHQASTVASHKLGRESVLLTTDDTLDGEEILPGFRLQLTDLFR
jgi:Uma2 family endonuclease